MLYLAAKILGLGRSTRNSIKPGQQRTDHTNSHVLVWPLSWHYDSSKCIVNLSFGLRVVLMQQDPSGWRPVVYITKLITETKCRYAQTEKVGLSATWVCVKDLQTTYWEKRITLEMDHKPQVPMLASKAFSHLPTGRTFWLQSYVCTHIGVQDGQATIVGNNIYMGHVTRNGLSGHRSLCIAFKA